MRDSIIKDKARSLAVRIINLYKFLSSVHREQVMSKQLLRCGTSIGANIYEGLAAQSDADFIAKFSIAQKETQETFFWIEILKETEYLTEVQYKSIYADVEEMIKLITAAIKTVKKKQID